MNVYDFLLSVGLLTTPEMQFQYGMQFSKQGAVEESELILKNVPIKQISDQNLYRFFRLLNNFRMNNKEEAEKHGRYLEDGFIDEMPRRYQALANLMIRDLKTWKNDDLGDIARDMNRLGNKIESAKVGTETQKLQKSVVDRLDKLIKKAEDKKSAAQQQADGQGQEGQEKGQGSGKGPKPMKDSQIGKDSGKGLVDEKKLKGLAENWGKLPEKDRANAMAELTRNMPPEYRDIIERYFKELAKAKGDK